jgi:hypothetical protein
MPNQLTLNLGVAIIQNQFDAAMEGVKAKIRSIPPVQIGAAFGGNINAGNADAVLAGIQSQGLEIKKVTGYAQNYMDAVGDTVPVITKLFVTHSDGVNTLIKDYKVLSGSLAGLTKMETGTGFGTDIGKQEAAAIKLYEARGKQFQAMEAEATRWSSRAETMGEKEKASIQSTAAALKEKIALYNTSLAQGQLQQAERLVPQINALNTAFLANVDSSKRAATGVQAWGSRLADAAKQTISYGLTLGLLRQAQMALSEAIKYTIDLNKELVNIQLLQVEGASTPEEIDALANSFNKLAQEMGTTTLEIAKGSVEWLN